nr:TIGR04388 family protein [Leptospira interrogans]
MCTYSALYAPPVVVPNLNTPVFNATSMDQTFNVANGMQTVGNWDCVCISGSEYFTNSVGSTGASPDYDDGELNYNE